MAIRNSHNIGGGSAPQREHTKQRNIGQSPLVAGSSPTQNNSEVTAKKTKQAVLETKTKTQQMKAVHTSATDSSSKKEQIGKQMQALDATTVERNAQELSQELGDTPSSGSVTSKFINKLGVTQNLMNQVSTTGLSHHTSKANMGAKKGAQDLLQSPPQTDLNEPVGDQKLTDTSTGIPGQLKGLKQELSEMAQDQVVGDGSPIPDHALPIAERNSFVDSLSVSVGASFDDSAVAGRFRMRGTNLADTGLSGVLSGGFGILKKDDYLPDGRILQVRSKQADINLGVKAGADAAPIPFSANIGIEGSYDVAYAKKTGPEENLLTVKKTDPPSRSKIQKNPSLLNVGDEIAFRGMLKLSVSAGVVEPHSQVKFSVGGSITNEFVTSISRLEGTPPKFKLHIEPGNRNIDGHASVGWGPFSVTGGASGTTTVQYNFEMSEAALQNFMKTGDLPKLPDPKTYLGSIDKLSERKQQKLINAFEDNTSEVRLISMGATKSSELYLEASASAAKAKTSSGHSQEVYIGDGEILRQDIHTMMESHSALFKGEKSTSLSLNQGERYTLDNQKNFVKTYVGLEASFKIGDTKTSQSDLSKRIEKANDLIGPNAPQLHLPNESSKSWDTSSLEIKANITPAVLNKLTELGGVIKDREKMSPEQLKNRPVLGEGNDPEAMVAFMKQEHGVSRTDVRAMLKDMHKISNDPKLAGKPDDIKRQQGIRMAVFLASGTTSVVNEEELKRIATIQRLVGPKFKVVEVGFSTDVHINKLNSLKLDSYLNKDGRSNLSGIKDTFISAKGSTPEERGSWTHFNTGAQKLKALEQVRENLVGDKNIAPSEKELLLKQVDEYLDALDVELSAQLDDPRGRKKIMEGLLNAGPILPTDLQSLYKSPETMYQDLEVREEFMDMVLQASLRDLNPNNQDSHKEIASLIKSIAHSDNGSLGIDEAFKLLNSAKEFSPAFEAKVVNEVGVEALMKMVPNMTNDQKMTLLGEIAPLGFPESSSSVKRIKNAIDHADNKGRIEFSKLDSKLDGIEKDLKKLQVKQDILLDTKSGSKAAKSEKVMSHFKEGYKDLGVPMDKIEVRIADSFLTLGEQRHLILSQRKDGLNHNIDHLLGGIDRMRVSQRQELLSELLKQDNIGSVSNLMLQRLIDSSSDEGELVKFAQDIESRIHKLDRNPPLSLSSSDKKVMRQELQARLTEVKMSLR